MYSIPSIALIPKDVGHATGMLLSGGIDSFMVCFPDLSSPENMILLFYEYYFSPIWEWDEWILYLRVIWSTVFHYVLGGDDHSPSLRGVMKLHLRVGRKGYEVGMRGSEVDLQFSMFASKFIKIIKINSIFRKSFWYIYVKL